MSARNPADHVRAIRTALARQAYASDHCRFDDPVVTGHDWLVTTNKGLFALSLKGAKRLIHGWFFGICRQGDTIYLFENCALRDRAAMLGRIVRLTICDGRLVDPVVLVKGLHPNAHQLRVIDGLLCLVDTANQQILRYRLDGTSVDVKRPFAVAPASDTSGAYLHINSITAIDGRIAIMCHNGPARPERRSEIAWLTPDWTIESREAVDGHHCHDIVVDQAGTIWYCASREGAIASRDGQRIHVSADCMTRGLCMDQTHILVGQSKFGPRQDRDRLGGVITIYDQAFHRLTDIAIASGALDFVALHGD